ncbi:MAG: hypothetical protein BMS9Abin34_128 [Patescibacteria group bacterium]|nr:MAG: hypothetical protein BMS9Abin34_128 [Patescibacteria group bacterium]
MVTLVVAGPGTGKTTFITTQIQKLLEKGVDPSNILALTFTDKAAQEMLGRLDEAMPLGYEPPWISTFHGFCDRVLRQDGLAIGLDLAYRIISEPEAWLLLRRNLFDLPLDYYRPLGNPARFLTALLNLFSRAKDEEVTPEAYLRWVEKQKGRAKTREERAEVKRQLELAKTYSAYQKLLIKNSYLDFGDLIAWTTKLFHSRPNTLKHYRQQFRYVFVDEFQDTNVAQFSLVKLLAPNKNPPNLVVVGDDDQAIYKWRGASVSNILEFKKVYKNAKVKVLNTSYRLTDAIAQNSYKLIKNNNPDRLEVKLPGITKKLKTLKTGPQPHLLYARSAEAEAELILRKIVELVNTTGKEFRDFAILARANAHLDPFVAALKRHALPFQVVGNRGLFEQEEVSALLAVLRVIKDPEDIISWFKVLNVPSFELAPQKVLGLLNRAKKSNRSFAEILKKEKISVLSLIDDLTSASFRVSPSHLLFDFVQKSGYVAEFVKTPTVENQMRVENISLFFQKIHQFEAEVKEPNIPELVDWLDMLIEAGESPAQAVIEDVDTINLMTVHAAKGLEFPVVFLVSLTSDRVPTRRRSAPIELPDHFVKEFKVPNSPLKDDQTAARIGHMQEERRLFYVGITRSSEKVFLSFAQNYGGLREKRPSPFIQELGIKVPEKPDGGSVLMSEEGETSVDKKLEEQIPVQIPKKLSYSQLDDYKTCPWKYRYKYILKIPAPPTPPLSFGISVHEALREFEARTIRGEKLRLSDLLKIYSTHFLEEGYRDKKEKAAYRRRGEKMLRNFYQSYKDRLSPALMVEKGFEIKLGGKTLTGRIDRIGKDEDGDFEIIDYKTSDLSTKDIKKLEKKAKKDDQLLIYSIAAREALGVDPKTIGFFYLDGGKKVSVDLKAEEIVKRKKAIEERIKKITAGEFGAIPGLHCVWCPFNKICPYSQADRYR